MVNNNKRMLNLHKGGVQVKKEVQHNLVLLKALGSLGVKGNMTIWKNQSANLGVMKKNLVALTRN